MGTCTITCDTSLYRVGPRLFLSLNAASYITLALAEKHTQVEKGLAIILGKHAHKLLSKQDQ